MPMRKCIHILATPDYEPELCSLTLPNLQRYADRIGADFNIITTRAFPDYPINYERMQIYTLGKDYDWNMNIDADVLMRRDAEDPSSYLAPEKVGIFMGYDARQAFSDAATNPVFVNDGRYLGVVDCWLAASRHTHELWKPLPAPFSEYQQLLTDGVTRRVSEYCISLNFAAHRYPYFGILYDKSQLVHLEVTSYPTSSPVERAWAQLRTWGEA